MSESFVSCGTNRTGLAGVNGVDIDNHLSEFKGFVFREHLELSERPTAELSVESFSEFLGLLDREFFKDECVVSAVNNRFADSMVYICNKPFFSSANFHEQSFCGTSAFTLQFLSEIEKLSLPSLEFFGSKKGIVRANCNFINSAVDTEHSDFFIFEFGIFNFNNHSDKKEIFSWSKNHAFNSSVFVFFEVFRNIQIKCFSAVNSADTDYVFDKFRCISSAVVSDRTVDSLDGFSVLLKTNSLENITGLVSCTLNQRTLKSRISFADKPIREFMQFVFIESFEFPADVNAILNSSIENIYCLGYGFVVRNLDGYGSLHTISLDRKVFKPIDTYNIMRKLTSSTYNINYHFVWCPKYRKSILGKYEKELKNLLETICVTKGWEIKELQIMSDHIHLFISTPPYESPSGIIKVLKGTSAIQLFKNYPELRKEFRKGHVWSPSYYVGTAGSVTAQSVEKYIREQCLNSSPQQVRGSP